MYMIWQSVRDRWQWRRLQERLRQHQPLLIGVTGSSSASLAQEAIALAVQGPHDIAYAPPQALRSGYGAAPQLEALLHGKPNTVILNIAAQHPGDIDWVAQQLPFQIVVATNVGSKNLDEFGDKNMVAHEHTSLVSTLPKTGHAILNADDELVANMAYHTTALVTLYGTSSRADVRLVRSLRLPTGRQGFALEVAVRKRHHQLSLPRLTAFSQIYAALAALAVADVLEKDLNQIISVLSELHPYPGQLSLTSTPAGAKILDGSAEATPETVLAALHTLRTWPAEALAKAGRRIAILGDLTDQAGETVSAHKRVGRAAAESTHIFIAVGQHMRHAGGEALLRRPGPDVHHFTTSAEVGEWLAPYLTEGDVILVMGSPNMHMQKVVTSLAE